jgi:DNA topoisomerase IB
VLLGRVPDVAQAIVDPRDAAESAGLRHVSDERPGIRRKKAGTGFTYTRTDGSRRSRFRPPSRVLRRWQPLQTSLPLMSA